MLKNILLQFTDLFNMTCVYYRVEHKLSVFIKTTLSCIQKKKLKLWFCVWTHMTWPRISGSTFPSKVSSHNSWSTALLSKMLCSNVPLTVQPFEYSALSPEFPGTVSSLNIWQASCLFRGYLKCIQLKSYLKSAFHYFYCFNGFKSVTMVTCQMGMWLNLVYMCCYFYLSTNHVRCPIMTWNFSIC